MDRELTRKVSTYESTELIPESLAQEVMNDERFKNVKDDVIKMKLTKLKQIKSAEIWKDKCVGADWSESVELDFLASCQAIRLDFRRGNVRTWSEAIILRMNSAISLDDVRARIRKLQTKALEKEHPGIGEFLPADNDTEDVLPGEEVDEDSMQIQITISEAAMAFAKLKLEGPTHRCGCCGQLFFRSNTKFYSQKRHDELYIEEDIKDRLSYLLAFSPGDTRRLVCCSCDAKLSRNEIPTFIFGEYLPHNEVIETISELSDLEADLCSPCIAFAKVMDVQWQGQKRLIGSVISVPARYKETVKALPRNDIKDFRITVDLKRKLEYSGFYKQGLVRPYEVRRACVLLCKSPLYASNEIVFVNTLDSYFENRADDEQEAAESDVAVSISGNGKTGNDYCSESSVSCDVGHEADIAENKAFEVQDVDDLEIFTIPKDKIPLDDQAKVVKREPKDLVKSHKDEHGQLIVSDDEDLYEDDELINEEVPPGHAYLDMETDGTELRQSCMRLAPAEGNHPQGLLRAKYGEELAFPRLFGGHPRRGYDNIPYFMIARHELRSADSRFAKDHQKIFFSMRKIHCQTVCGMASMSVRRAHKGKVTAQQLLNPIDQDEICHHDLGFLSLKRLKTSPDYKAEIKKDIFAMIKQLGKPNWFLTLTCGDTRWPELSQILYTVKHGKPLDPEVLAKLTSTEHAKLVTEDPVTCARYFQRRSSRFITDILSNTDVISKVIDYAGVDEFTAMGNPHTHLLLWVEKAPVFQVDNDADVVSHIDKYLSTDIGSLSPDLGNVQRHMHKPRCGGRYKKCSFGFPKPPMRQTIILHPEDNERREDPSPAQVDFGTISNALRFVNIAMRKAVTEKRECPEAELDFDTFLEWLGMTEMRYHKALCTSIDRPTVFHRRKLKHIMVNAFNKNLLLMWNANIDLQYILNPWAATMYVASYISKSSKGLSALLRNIKAGQFKNSAEMIKRAGSAWINTTEVPAQEAVYHVLGLPFRRFSRGVQFMNTNTTNEQHCVALPKADLEGLSPDDTECFQKTQQEKYGYRGTHPGLCMADYFAKFEWKRLKTAEGTVSYFSKPRKRPKVLRFIGIRRSTDLEGYCREKIMLFLPWKGDFDDLFPEQESWLEVYNANIEDIQTNEKKYCQVSESEWQEICDEVEKEIENIEGRKEAIEGETFGDKMQGGSDPREGNDQMRPGILTKQNTSHFVASDEFTKTMISLNPLQKQVYDYVLRTVRDCHFDECLPKIKLFVTGGAGVGKSTLVKVIVQAVTHHFNYDEHVDIDMLRVLLVAPTGKAAFNIGGLTVHSAVSIKPNFVKSSDYPPLSNSALSTFQSKFGNLKLLVVDEISMLGSQLLNVLEMRLRQIMNDERAFGGLHALFVGDLYQLRPVRASWVFKQEHALAKNHWLDFKMVELTQIMRQKGDQRFAELLNRMRVGKLDTEDMELLATRQHPVRLDIPYLFTMNRPKDQHNDLVYYASDGVEHEFVAVDKLAHAMKSATDKEKEITKIVSMATHETAGLPRVLRLKVGLPVELTSNVATEDGLCNGTDGVLQGCTSANGRDLLWILFFNKAIGADTRRHSQREGFHLDSDLDYLDKDWTPIQRISKDVMRPGKRGPTCTPFFARLQFPVVLAAARTVHHCQGSTLETGGINFCGADGSPKCYAPSGIHYTALSRFTSLRNVYLAAFDVSKLKVDPDVEIEMERLYSEAMLELEPVCLQRGKGDIALFYQNVRSFNKHAEYLLSRDHVTDADVTLMVETCCSVIHHKQMASQSHLSCIECPGAKNRPRGVAFMASAEVAMTEVARMTATSSLALEGLMVKVVKNSKTLLLLGLYKSPKIPYADFQSSLSSFLTGSPCLPDIILGDFNIDLDNPDLPIAKHLTEFMTHYGYSNVRTGFTRSLGVSKSRLDHVWVSPHIDSGVEVGYDWFSDHMPMFCHSSVMPEGRCTLVRRKSPFAATARDRVHDLSEDDLQETPGPTDHSKYSTANQEVGTILHSKSFLLEF